MKSMFDGIMNTLSTVFTITIIFVIVGIVKGMSAKKEQAERKQREEAEKTNLINTVISESRQFSTDELIWTRPKLTQKYFDDTITIFGHTPTHFYGAEHYGKAVKTPTWIDIDTGAAYDGGSPMLLRLDDMKEFYI